MYFAPTGFWMAAAQTYVNAHVSWHQAMPDSAVISFCKAQLLIDDGVSIAILRARAMGPYAGQLYGRLDGGPGQPR
jgi:hypothetical protein